MNKTLFSTTEMAEWLGVFHTTARRWIEQGKIKGIRVGRNYKIPIEEAVRVLNHYEIPLPECLSKYQARKEGRADVFLAEKALNSSILKKLLVVEEIEDPALACTQHAVLGANEALCRLLGYTQLGLIGANLRLVMDQTAVAKLVGVAETRKFNGSGGVTAYEAGFISREGDAKKVQVTASALDQVKGVYLLVVKPINGR